jgi:hypothetical protein
MTRPQLWVGFYSDAWCGSDETFYVVAQDEGSAAKQFDALAYDHYLEIGSDEDDAFEQGLDKDDEDFEASWGVTIEPFDEFNEEHVNPLVDVREPEIVEFVQIHYPDIDI